MFGGLGKFEIGHFSSTPEEEEKDPKIKERIDAANKALKVTSGGQARESLQRHFNGTSEEGKKIEKVA